MCKIFQQSHKSKHCEPWQGKSDQYTAIEKHRLIEGNRLLIIHPNVFAPRDKTDFASIYLLYNNFLSPISHTQNI